MAINQDWAWAKWDDGVLVVTMAPPVAIGGWDIRAQLCKRFESIWNSSGLVNKSVASGFNGQSGIVITDSGRGVFYIQLNSQDFSGFDYGNYAYQTAKFNSGSRTALTEGFSLLQP